MGFFYTDSVALTYSNIEAAEQWWIDAFGCKVVRVPQDWDNPLPSDVALTLPGDSAPTILLSVRSEVEKARFDRPSPVATVIFCNNLKKAREHFTGQGVIAGPIQDGGDMQLFEIRDPEGHLIEIAKEP
jgi:catechol 2,3-dioxygenase-like lactoylglutathione lyase family enzyme